MYLQKYKHMKGLIAFIVLLLMFQSCKITNSLVQLNKKHAKVYSYTLGNKEIKYVPMHHLGKKAFYDDVTRIVKEYKSKGYVVYYELISTDFTNDSLLKDTIRRKVRKIKGFSGSYKDNANDSFLKKYIQQPEYSDLGVDSTDLRADVDYLQLINEWENQNGVIILDSLDLNTPFGQKFSKGINYTDKQYKAVIIEYRNAYLIDLIKNSPYDKILVLYGAGHRKNFKKQLKSL